MNISEIDASHLNEIVEIAGQIVGVWDLTKGRKYQIKDATGEIPLIIWDSVLEAIPSGDRLRAGATLSLAGRVSEYKGELRIVPAAGADVRLTQTVDDQVRPATKLADLSTVGAGRSVWVTGAITAMQSFSKGHKLRITDGSGDVTILLWENIYEALPVREQLQVNRRVGVYGEVTHFRDEWEIVPRSVIELVILE